MMAGSRQKQAAEAGDELEPSSNHKRARVDNGEGHEQAGEEAHGCDTTPDLELAPEALKLWPRLWIIDKYGYFNGFDWIHTVIPMEKPMVTSLCLRRWRVMSNCMSLISNNMPSGLTCNG